MKHLLSFSILCFFCLTVTACGDASWKETLFFWKDGKETTATSNSTEKSLTDEHAAPLVIDEAALTGNSLPEPTPIKAWLQEAADPTHYSGHIAGSTLSDITATASVGEGNAWREGAIAPSIIATEKMVIAMDGNGYISAHDRRDIDTVLWQYEGIAQEDPLLTAGLAMEAETVYAINNQGDVAAIAAKNGKELWKLSLAEAVRSSLRVHDGLLFFVTADGQLFALSTKDGALIWQYRAVGHISGLFSTSLPAILDPFIITAFPSGELISLLMRSGEMLWNDNIQPAGESGSTNAFSGIDANPIIESGMLIAGNATNLTTAYNAANGTKLWELPFGIRSEPWIAGNAAFFISTNGEVIGLHRYRGVVAWRTEIKNAPKETHRFYGTYLINDTLLVVSSMGDVIAFSPESGKKLWVKSIDESFITPPSFQGKDAFILTQDADLLQLR